MRAISSIRFICSCYRSSVVSAVSPEALEPFLVDGVDGEGDKVDPRGVLPVEEESPSTREPAREDRPLNDPPIELPIRRRAPPILDVRPTNVRRGVGPL